MKIGFDAKRVFTNHTGLGNYSRTLIDNLARYSPEHDYVLFTPEVRDNSFGKYYNEKFPVITPRPGKSNSFWRSYGIADDIKNEKLEVFHGLSNELPFRLPDVKKVVTIHDLIFKVFPTDYPFFDRQVFDLKSRKSCKNADIIIAISASTKADIIKYYGIPEDKIKVVYQACAPIYYEKTPLVSDLRSKYNLPKDFLLSVGSVIERKNLYNTVKAYALLPSDMRIPLVVVGKGKRYKSKVLTLLRKEGLQDSVIWLENVKELKDLKALYQAARLSLYPSKHEGFGLPVAESLLCKTAVITSNISSLPEAGGPHAYGVDPDNPEEIKNAIELLLSDENLRKEKEKAGYHYAMENFSPERINKQLVDVYQS